MTYPENTSVCKLHFFSRANNELQELKIPKWYKLAKISTGSLMGREKYSWMYHVHLEFSFRENYSLHTHTHTPVYTLYFNMHHDSEHHKQTFVNTHH